MRLWFAHGTDVSLREQLVTQVVLGIQCGDLPPGQRLPSTRELARRFHLHANTVSAGYNQLVRQGWLEFRRGSGVYVSETKPAAPLSPALALDELIAQLFRSARKLGATQHELRARLRQWLEMQPPDHFLLIEPDEELRRVVAAEMQQVVKLPVRACAWRDARLREELDGAMPVVLPRKDAAPPKDLRLENLAASEPVKLQVRSVHASLAEWLPAPSEALVGVASRWPDFLKLARTLLLAAGVAPESLVFRDARRANWQRGMGQTAAVVCDAVTARELSKHSAKGLRVLVFRLLSEASLEELQRLEQSLQNPLETAS
jgi:DNA-binding transcriptional regulator YhcF (GntR family)